jgi:hypothetical protein
LELQPVLRASRPAARQRGEVEGEATWIFCRDVFAVPGLEIGPAILIIPDEGGAIKTL